MASVLSILLLLAFTSFLSCFAESGRKEFRDKGANKETVIQLGHFVDSYRIDPSRVVQLSWQPRVFLYKGFLSEEECDHFTSLAHGVKKTILGNDYSSGHVVTNWKLTSSEIPLNIKDDVVSRIEERISAWTFLPKENSRPLQVMHFGIEEVNQNYDYFGNKSTLELTKPLMAIVVLYLSNVTQGGEILFPESELGKIWSSCTKSSSILRPIKGNAILFFTLHPNASLDKSSSHARCPVLEGEMWYATKLFHIRSISGEKVSPEADGTECTDEDENCPRWATIGECQRNHVFMIGSPDYYGTCRKSCNAC
ncbi:probable prolyl 4-hydroxylase 12 isoform X1 [Corylus avellana]|uniref:probable prolyl 4-hydroxylase 12 isoform X1 n=1 Tax=Corylus avellana TaxID=13451 RepID=UPI00286ADB08|nr:probable prolyl 4-hydroxylase 12 isoform X1 [Corylus avellana]